MYQFTGVDEPREHYAELVRLRDQERLERQVARDGHHARLRLTCWARRFLARRRVGRSRLVRGVVGA